MRPPIISVVMATYNHASYVAEAIQSVLQQRDVDFEFLIADDASVDRTAEVVASIKDPRIRFFPQDCNRGACIVTNELIAQARGEFIALINSDDRWLGTDKLAVQLEVLRNDLSLGACFGRVCFIDKTGKNLSKHQLPFGSVFDQNNRSQGRWLRYFFEYGNCLCHPTMLIRRRCYEKLGSYNNNYRQLPDFDMWIRLVKNYPIHIMERELVEFRVLPSENASSYTVNNSVRIMNEHYLIAETFFEGVSTQQLREGFSDQLRKAELPSDVHADIEKALLLLAPNKGLGKVYSLIGLLKLNRLLASVAHQLVLKRDYDIDGLWFQKRTAEIDALRPRLVAILGKSKYYIDRVLKFFMTKFRG